MGKTEFNRGGSKPGENSRAGDRAQNTLQAGRRAPQPGHRILVLHHAGVEPFGAASIYLGWPRREKSRSSDLEAAFSR